MSSKRNYKSSLDKLFYTEMREKSSLLNPVSILATSMVIILGIIIHRVLVPRWDSINCPLVIVTGLLALVFLTSLKIAEQWEKVIILRLGKFHKLAEAGMFFIIPVIDRVSHIIDMRIKASDFNSESTLTKDTVPVNVDAICFWMVWDAKKSILEVENYYNAIILSAQTALRDIIGSCDLAKLLSNRGEIGEKLKDILDSKTNPWGITIQSVEIRDIIIPKELEDAMSKQAQAERERQARIILGTAEAEIADKFAEASDKYKNSPEAMHLRGMNMLFEGLKENSSLVIVPSSALDTMNFGATGGLAALAKSSMPEKKSRKKTKVNS